MADKEGITPTDMNVQSSPEGELNVGERLTLLNDKFVHNDDVHASESILLPTQPGNTATINEHDPSISIPWYRRIADKVGALVTNDSAYYNYGNDVYDPDTGKTTFEFMPLYARIGMHALFVGSAEEKILEGGYLKKLFLDESVKSGKHFDDPKSTASIPGFVKTYSISLSELLEKNISDFPTFNHFFFRKLEPTARPPADPEDPSVAVSCADCRLVVFKSVTLAQKFWVKGDQFSIPKLLGDTVPDVSAYSNGTIGIFRLAPQDYHRFHSPVTGTIVSDPRMVNPNGALWTVNPMAVKSTLDVLTSNKRATLPILTQYSTTPVIVVAVGALLVGSINWTENVKSGASIKKGEELGYFAYGGSTVIVLWPEDMNFQIDEIIEKKSFESVECIVKVGRRVGKMGV